MHRPAKIILGASLAALGIVFAARALPASPDGPPQADMAIDAATCATVIDGVTTSLRQAYVFPEVAAEIERGLQARRRQLESITSAKELAATLTQTLRALAHDDQHLELSYSEAPLPETTGDTPSPEEARAQRQYSLRRNAGIETVQRFPGNVGLLEFKKFYRPDTVAPRLPAVMTLLAETSALIIDLRECRGGDPETVMLVASYFFDTKTHLNDVYWRDENRTEERWTDPNVEGLRYGEQRKLYLLVSHETASGCEDFAYALQNAKRATLVGETTAGAAHAGSPRRLGPHFMLFVPSGRPVSPVTHTDWERVGVVADVKTSAKKALDVARLAALKHLHANESDPDWKRRLAKAINELE
jgi:Peptidase family S41/N-terminal domain of Peptidase_S41 in eukaryotic IRBP